MISLVSFLISIREIYSFLRYESKIPFQIFLICAIIWAVIEKAYEEDFFFRMRGRKTKGWNELR